MGQLEEVVFEVVQIPPDGAPVECLPGVGQAVVDDIVAMDLKAGKDGECPTKKLFSFFRELMVLRGFPGGGQSLE